MKREGYIEWEKLVQISFLAHLDVERRGRKRVSSVQYSFSLSLSALALLYSK